MTQRSLRDGTDYKSKWYPIPVHVWRHVLLQVRFQGIQLFDTDDVRSNLSYNLQYVEYLQQTLNELSLSAVLEKLTYKSYIVSAVGIIEAVLYHVVKASGKKQEKLVRILKALESRALLGADPEIYEDLHRFRKLRNKVHIYESRDEIGTDYASFGIEEYLEIRQIVFDLFRSDNLEMDEEARGRFDFLAHRDSGTEC